MANERTLMSFLRTALAIVAAGLTIQHFANPVWLQYLSHKVARLAIPWALAGAFLASAALMFDGWFYALAFALQSAFYGLAGYGGWSEHRARRTRAFGATVTEVAR